MQVIRKWVPLAAFLLAVPFAASSVRASDDAATAVEGTVKKVDSATKTMIVTTKDGTDHTIHFTDKSVVHGAKDTGKGFDFAGKEVKEGSDVVVHVSKKGSVETADELDHVGKDGMHAAEGTITKVDHTGKTVTVKSADGTEHVYKVSSRALATAGKSTDDAVKKGTKTTVYYTEDGVNKVVHFFKF